MNVLSLSSSISPLHPFNPSFKSSKPLRHNHLLLPSSSRLPSFALPSSSRSHQSLIVSQLLLLDAQDHTKDIRLFINSPGGSLRSMLITGVSPTSSFSLPLTRNFSAKRSISTTTRFRVCANGAAKVEYTPWLIVGLGNPGNKYHGTRHNVGFKLIDQISEKEGIVLNTIQSKALMGLGSIGQVPVLLAKPQAYMNYIGESVGPLAAYYKVPLRHILLVYDEMNLPNGVLRLQQKGGHGYHSGVKSVMAHLDSRREFPRVCIGIGNPPGTMDMKAFLLQKFSPSERKQIDAALEQGVDAVRTLVFNGFNDSITRFNLSQKFKYHKV